jgi:C4-dicarboxylate-specific signal transduction histidine kinase
MVGIPVGTYAPWTMLDDLSTVLILAFVIDATLSVLLRREATTADRKRALVVGAGIISCVVIAGGSGILMHSFSAPVTYLISVGFMAVVLPVGYELSNDLIKASRLTGELKESLLHLARLQQEIAHFSRVSLMGELSASLAHELNQPLTAIMANAQAAQRFIANDRVDVDEFREILKDIVYDTTRARDVIRNVRTLVKKGEREMSPLHLNEVAEQVVQFLHGDIVGRNLTLKQDLAKNLPSIMGDRTQIQQVLINLLLNAFDAVGANPIPRRQVTLATVRENGAVHIRVQDTGPGIKPEHLEHLFQPFFTTKANGMGMGLTVSRSIVEAHGGRLWAENLPGSGARLNLTLPAASGNCEGAHEPSSSNRVCGG